MAFQASGWLCWCKPSCWWMRVTPDLAAGLLSCSPHQSWFTSSIVLCSPPCAARAILGGTAAGHQGWACPEREDARPGSASGWVPEEHGGRCAKCQVSSRRIAQQAHIACSPSFLLPPPAALQLEWGRGRVFDAEVGAMFQRLVVEAKQVGGHSGAGHVTGSCCHVCCAAVWVPLQSSPRHPSMAGCQGVCSDSSAAAFCRAPSPCAPAPNQPICSCGWWM